MSESKSPRISSVYLSKKKVVTVAGMWKTRQRVGAMTIER